MSDTSNSNQSDRYIERGGYRVQNTPARVINGKTEVYNRAKGTWGPEEWTQPNTGFKFKWDPTLQAYAIVGTVAPTPIVGVASNMPEFDSSAYGSALSSVNTNLRRGLGQVEAGSRNRQIGFQDLLRQIGGRAAGSGVQFRSGASESGSYRTPDVMKGMDIIRGREAIERSGAYGQEAAAAAADRAKQEQLRIAAENQRADILMKQAAARAAQINAWLASQVNPKFGGK